MHVPAVRKCVLVAARAFDLARISEPHPRLAEEVEAHVRERDVFLEDRTLADPFAEALREHEVAVAEAQQEFEALCVGHG